MSEEIQEHSRWRGFILNGVAIAIAVLFIYLVRSVFLPVILAIVLSYALNPLVNFMAKLKVRVGGRDYELPDWIAIILSIIIFIFVLILFFIFILPPFVNQFNLLSRNFPYYLTKMQAIWEGVKQTYISYNLPANFSEILGKGATDFTATIMNFMQQAVFSLLSIFSQFIKLIIIPVMAFYLLRERKNVRENIVYFTPEKYKGRVKILLVKLNKLLKSYIRGQLILCLVVGTAVWIGLTILGVKYALILGLIAGVTEAIPILGPFIGGVPAVLIALIISPELALKVIILYVIIQQIENIFLVPKIMGHHVKLNPLTIIIAMLVFGELMGTLGLFIAAPCAAIIKEIYLFFKEPQIETIEAK